MPINHFRSRITSTRAHLASPIKRQVGLSLLLSHLLFPYPL